MPAIEITAQEWAHHMAMLPRTHEVRRKLRNLPVLAQREEPAPSPHIQLVAFPVLPVKPVPLIHASARHVYKTPLRFPVFVPADAPEGYNPNKPKLLPRDIIAECARLSGLEPDDLLSSARTARFVRPRQFAMWRVHKQCHPISLPQIGRTFGGRDHTTALAAVRKIQRLIDAGVIDPANPQAWFMAAPGVAS